MLIGRDLWASGCKTCVCGLVGFRRACSSAEEIRRRRERYGDKDRQYNPYSGPASPYGTVAKTQSGFFRMINDQGGINGRKINFITLHDGYSPPKTVTRA